MANTKNITDRNERKGVKRTQRKALKAVNASLTIKQRKKYRASDTVGLRAWLAEQSDS